MWALALMAASTIYGGISALQSSEQQAKLQKEQGLLEKQDYEYKAAIVLDEGYRLRQQQAMDYIGAGVEIMGTPLLMLAETKKRTETEASHVRATGQRVQDLYNTNAKITQNQGRAQFISSILSTAGKVAGSI